jgi:hypothetical protein
MKFPEYLESRFPIGQKMICKIMKITDKICPSSSN